MRKGQVVKDAATGKKFALGKTGLKGLRKRVTEYAKTQDVDEVLVETPKTPVGQAFTMKCTKCGERFHIGASKEVQKYITFKEDCIAHARQCGVGAAIIPIR